MNEELERKCLFDFGDEFLESFEVLGEIGRGSFGAVLRARQLSLDRQVAIKYLLPNLSGKDLKRRFKREAKVLCALNHPNVLNIFSYGIDGKAVYLVQELLKGLTLERFFLAEVTPDVNELLRICADVTAALSYCHSQKVFHRDVKPANIFICEDGQAKLLDFGLAKGDKFDTQLTATGCLAGTPLYLAPEQLYESEPHGACDVYALGVVLYEGLTGINPFESDSLDGLYRMKVGRKPTPLNEVMPELPQSLCSLVDELLELEPDERPTAARVEKKLRSLSQTKIEISECQVKRTDATAPLVVKQPKPKRSYLFLLPACLLLAGLLLVFFGREKPFELSIRVLDTSCTSLTVYIDSSLVASVKVDVIDSKTRSSCGVFQMPGKGRSWQGKLDRLPAGRKLTLIGHALVPGKEPKLVEVEASTKPIKPMLMNQWKSFEMDAGPAVHGNKCCLLTKEKGYVTFEIDSGKLLWQQAQKKKVLSVGGNQHAVFIVDIEGQIRALGWESGEDIWQVDLRGKTSNLRVDDDVVVVKGPLGRLICLEGETGKRRWVVGRLLRGGWSVIDDKIYITTLQGRLLKVDVKSGRANESSVLNSEHLTEDPLKAGEHLCFPVDDDKLIIARQDELLLALALEAHITSLTSDDETVFLYMRSLKKLLAIDVKSGQRLWTATAHIDRVDMFSHQGLFYFTDKRNIRCFHSRTGNLLWQTNVSVARRAPPLMTEDGIAFWARDGRYWKLVTQ